jgi:citrate lyase beta subunit
VDTIILDLEDGVAFNRKDAARLGILAALQNTDFGRSERMVRINPLYSGRAEEDLHVVLRGRPDAILVPKVDGADIVREVDTLCTKGEKENGLEHGSIALALTIESGLGFVHLAEICQASDRVQALIFGGEDFAADTGITRSPDGHEELFARSSLVLHAAAFGLQAIDRVHTNYLDLEELEKACLEGAHMGFTGKQVIHPAQIGIVHRTFSPDEKAIEHARRVVEGAHDAQKAGKGAFVLDGYMVDLPVVKRAEAILARARAAGLL